MRDIIIKSKQIRKEFFSLMICFVVSFLGNVGAVIYYKASTIELFSSLPYVLIFSIFLYGVWLVLRIFRNGLIFLIRKR